MIVRKVQKAGGSFYITLPGKYVRDMKLEEGGYITLQLIGQTSLVIEPVKKEERREKRNGI